MTLKRSNNKNNSTQNHKDNLKPLKIPKYDSLKEDQENTIETIERTQMT